MALVPFVLLLAAFFTGAVISLDHDKQFRTAHKIKEECSLKESQDIMKWNRQLQEGKLTKEDFDFLLQGRQSLCKNFEKKQ